jgi:N-acetylglucosaminyldiphosphoundecaprenol N-acetyl-beta-D-mannosaminyltransferase
MAHASQRGFRVYLLGGADGVAERAAERLKETFPELIVCGTSSPRVSVSDSESVRAEQVARVKETHPQIVLVAFGAPKQEVWIQDAAPALAPCVLLGIGASLDFVAGVAQRSPAWMSRTGLEWLYRLAKEPRRLWRRYLLRDPKFLAILLRTARGRRSSAASTVQGGQPTEVSHDAHDDETRE